MSVEIPKIEVERSWHLIAVELVGLPRRVETTPHLYIGKTTKLVEERFSDFMAGQGPETFAGKWLRLRQDVLEFRGEIFDKKQSEIILRSEKERLARKGHAINGSYTVWHTYVIDLDPTGFADVGQGFVYVGQTSHTPEERYSIHKNPKPVSAAIDLGVKLVRERGLGLNYALASELSPQPPFFLLEDALDAEIIWAETLYKRKFKVEAGHVTPGRKQKKKSTN
jgi:hypothetical protein